MALWEEPRGSSPPRASASFLCMIVTLGGLVALAVAIKWLIGLI